MFKAAALLKRKKGMTMPEFIHHYETVHALLAVKGVPSLKKYVRHFLTSVGNDEYGVSELPYDAITEIWFDDRADFERGMAELVAPATRAAITADEVNLFEKDLIRFVTFEDHESELGKGYSGDACQGTRNMFKAAALLKRKKGMSMPDFIKHYETVHALLAVKGVPSLKKYVRHFLTSVGNDEYGVSELPYDAITEIWFDDRADFERGMAELIAPETRAAIIADEVNLFEKDLIRFVTFEDRESELGKGYSYTAPNTSKANKEKQHAF
jgi:uncharacterized protein (TIGR02118 family)